MKKIITFGLCVLLCCSSLLFAESVELVGGKLKLVLYPKTGTFSLYHLSDVGKNRYEPLYEDRNDGITNWYSVNSNGRIFKLEKKPFRPVEIEVTETGAKFIFTPSDDFQVEQEFSFVNDPETAIPAAVRIETRVENTSGKVGTFAVKALYDTILGENQGIHFSTDLRNRVSTETKFVAGVNPDKVLVSQNKTNSLMFLLGESVPNRHESMYVANWNRLNTHSWLPEFVEGRSFNTQYSINDSAVLIVWPERKLAANRKMITELIIGPYTPSLIPGYVPGSAAETDRLADSEYVYTEAEMLSFTVWERQQAILRLFERIEEIEANPESATDEELVQLNEALDFLLEQTQE
ncbi:hypothetical protein K7I13_00660 [Brucepastera parasyntrophica]|uniref:hypothetical protein n=1 Tax=Brucepastera parasyntrophica TaxID=2880008 RepID=UPI002108C2B3|nr:hypothetical protein [Brucepastera parasyntrophica]ULQ59897.1 hypothetical protein K7I13_00660 [Brucepastera parasyntrophica]